ncbi:MAG TPA: hypothetical protein DCS67_09190 [Clostridiales bacterium UBA8960]|nr:hypothetical protein [Clostridiales bacterium UBA8960]
MSNTTHFLPVILGTDSNAYGMAKAFHMAYGIKSLVVGQGKLFTTTRSKILDVKIIDDFVNPELFAMRLIELAKEKKKTYEKLILIASSDGYVELIVNNKALLSEYYIVPFIDSPLMQTLNSKEGFYRTCEQYGLSYPLTRILGPENLENLDGYIDGLPFEYPLVLKPSDSMRYFEAKFEGKQKAFIIDSRHQLMSVIKSIYASSYNGAMILQEYISGDDTSMRVLNCVSGPDGKVALMVLGQPLLEDCTPSLIGNYTAIIDAYDPSIFEEYKTFLESIGYIGFSNFDMKYDSKTGKFKVFEINLRQGRSSFFVTGSGYNQAKALVDAFIIEKNGEVVFGHQPHLWLGIPPKVLKTYLSDATLKSRAETLIKAGKVSYTLYYDKDFDIIRHLKVYRYYKSYEDKYKKYFIKKN